MATDWIKSADFEGNDDLSEALTEIWPDGDRVSTIARGMYLAAAKSGCLAYAPALAPGADVPDDYRLAQVMQARNIYNAGAAPSDGGGDLSAGGYGLTSYPLDWHVKQLLRPQQGIGAIW